MVTTVRSETYQATPPKTNNALASSSRPLPTFLDHISELRRRLFWVVALVLVASSVAYGFLNTILDVLTRPLGGEQLFYLTPAGGLSFSFKLCAYVGMIIAVPLVMFHIYRFLEPLMGQWRKSAVFYLGLSTALAAAGVLFAYFVSLPAALHFLTGFNIGHIQAMLTVDSYLTFVMTYLLGAALLFQIPLLLLIINTMTPLKPSKLMKMQRYVVVGAFLLGAIISPTPDIMNQTFLALPVIAMYQLGVVMIWLQNKRQARVAQKVVVVPQPHSAVTRVPHELPGALLEELTAPPIPTTPSVSPAAPMLASPAKIAPRPVRSKMYNDVIVTHVQIKTPQGAPPVARATYNPRSAPKLNVPMRSVDGFIVRRSAAPA